MDQTETKIQSTKTLAPKWRILSLAVILPLFFSTLITFAADLNPETILALTNKEREMQNLAPLTANPTLQRAAELKAEDMLKNDYFAHTSPSGHAPWHWMKEVGYSYQFAGENLAVSFDSAAAQSNAWMKSKTHRENILNKQYTEAGIAVVQGNIQGKTSFVTVALFGTPAPAVATKDGKIIENALQNVPALPLVKGAQTTVSQIDARNLLSPALYPKYILQGALALLENYRETILRNAEVLAKVLMVLSLAAPGAIFALVAFREIKALTPKGVHSHPM